jgi:Protein of unknown function (DUF3304)
MISPLTDLTQARTCASTFMRQRLCALALAALCLPLTGCTEEETSSISYLGVNHTDEEVVSFLINGEGGILNVPAQGGGGGEVCCVSLPKQWRPGLKVTIKWQHDGTWLKDAQGKTVIRDGIKVFVPAPWKERTVEIPAYTRRDLQHFDVHFLPGDQIIAKPSYNYPEHPDYLPPYPGKKKLVSP